MVSLLIYPACVVIPVTWPHGESAPAPVRVVRFSVYSSSLSNEPVEQVDGARFNNISFLNYLDSFELQLE